MKKSCHKVTAVIPALLLVACVDNRNDFTGVSPNSEETTASLPAPENLSATASDNEVSLSWDTVDGASAYNVYIYNQSGYIQSNYSPANPSAADTSASAIVSTNSHLLSSLEYEVDYYFNVTALADDLESNQSNEVGVRPLQNFSNSTPSVQLLNTNVNAAEVVTLSAEVSDPDGNNISYLWQQTSGASVDIVDGNESEATFTAPTVDTPVELGFALTVFDNLGASSTSSATVTVSDNLVPQVDAGADQSVSSGATVNLLGSVSDSDGSVVDIAWQQDSGSIVSLSNTSTLATSFTAPSATSSELTLVFQLSATDDRGDSATDTVSVIVTADQATTTIYRVEVAENSNGTIHVATTMDPEQESLTYSLSGTDAANFSIDSSSGAISFLSTPDYEVPTDANTDNAYELTFAVSNGTTTTLQELVITVTDVDEAPTITSAPDASTPENTTSTFTTTATDPENNPLSYSLSGTDAANFTINPSSGAISFTTIPDYENPADSDANNVYSLTLEVSDSTHTTSQALSITVTNIDEPPSITSTTAANILENTTTTIYTASASDPENDTLSYSLSATDAAHLSINPNSGAISFAINPDYENPADADANNVYELTLEVSDSAHTTSQALAITVDDTNDNAPIITAAQSLSIDENSANGSAIGTVVATDADASPTTYQDWTITSGNTNAAFAIDSSSGELSVATSSELDHESTASYTLALSVSDGVNTASAETLSINVDDVNDNAPIITAAQSFSIDENSANGTIIGTVVATDADTSPTTYQDWIITSGSAAFAIDSSSGELSVATSSELDYESTASYTLELSVSDGVNSASAETLSINLSNVNEQPSFTSAATASVNENDSSFAYTATATDVDAADSLTYSISGGADAAAFTLNGASLGFIAAANYESPADSNQDNIYEVELQVTDVGGLSDYLDLQISVVNVNEAPSFTSVDATVDVPENTSGTIYTLEASDVDSDDTDDTLTYSIAGGADKLSFSLDGAELSFINPPNYEAPQAAGSDANIYTVELAVSDDEGKAAAANLILSFQVTDANEAPVFTSVSGTYDVAENTSDTIFTLAASDVDSGDTDDTLTYSIAGGADQLSFSLDGAKLSFAIPPPDYENPQAAGADANIYTVELAVSDDDGKASETNLILSFNVTDVNEAPTIASATSANIPENTTATIYTASGTDPENDTLSYSLSGTDAANFTIDSSSGAISFAIVPDYENPADSDANNVYVLTLEVSDSTHTTSQALTISVTDSNEIPTITSATSASITENTSIATTIYTASATDPENDTLTYSLSGTDQDDFTIDSSSGAISFAATPNYEAPTNADTDNDYQVTLEASDGSNTVTQELTFTITDVNEHSVSAPTDADDATNQIAEDAAAGTAVGITASASDADGTYNTVSYGFTNGNQTSDDNLFSIDPNSGIVKLLYSNSLDYETATSHDIVIKASSSDGSSATHAFTIDVTDVDEFDVSFATEPDADSSPNQISEDAAAGTAVGITASASDADGTNNTVSYSFDNDLLTSGFFSIDASSGVVTLTNSNSLDYETATSHNIAVKASSSDGSSATHTFTVTVTDVDEFDVSFDTEPDADSSLNQIAEDATAGTPVGITASASDADGTNNTVSYSFDNDLLTSGFFSIDASSGVVTLTNSNSLDYETATSHDIAVKATSSDGSSATHTFTVSVIDVDEFNVVFATEPDADSSPNQIAEDAAAGTPVGITASASDDDGTNNTVSYSFDNDSQTSADNLFSIASDTGIVTLAASNSLDYENATSHDIVVKATSSDGSSTTETFTITVTDINDNTPIITASQSFDIDEASANGTSVGTVGFTDADSDAVNTFTWTITGGNTNDAFAIDPSTGELTVNTSSELDYESGTILYTLSLTVSDGATTSSTETVTINILDVSEHDAAPSAAYLGLPDNYINITFTPESGVSYQLHRSFVEGCISSSCDAEGYKSFASPNSSGTADTMTFSQTHYYSLVGDNATTFTTSINDSDGAKLAALIAAQSLTTEYDLPNDWVNISSTDSNNVTYTLYMAGEPFAAGGCEDSELDNISSLCADGSSLSDGSMHSATEVINWSARRYYRLDISDGYQVVHSLESNASVIDPVVLNASNASLTIDITWSALNSAKLAEYTVYLSDDSAATTASADTWSSLSNPQIISGNSGELYSLVPILSQYYVAITATNTENETTPLSKVYLVNNIVTGDPDPSTWHEIIADTDDSPAHWEGRSTHGSLVFQDKMWLIGGRTASENHIAEVWSSTDGYNWTEVNPSAAFGARKEFVSMVHDGKMWVLGGEIEGNLLANDVWYSSDGATWHEATPAASWHVRDYFGGVAFASGATGSDEMWVLGHYTGDARGIPGVEDHHYSTDGSTWSSVSVSGLPPSSFFPAITFNNVILIVGGYFYTNSAWSESNTIYSSTDGVNWAELSVSGSIWDARRVHTTLVYDDKLWILAGYSGYNRDDYWYSPDGTQWHEAIASGSKWEARKVHTSVNYAGRMWMLGGEGSTGDRQLNDVWASGLEITSFSFNLATTN